MLSIELSTYSSNLLLLLLVELGFDIFVVLFGFGAVLVFSYQLLIAWIVKRISWSMRKGVITRQDSLSCKLISLKLQLFHSGQILILLCRLLQIPLLLYCNPMLSFFLHLCQRISIIWWRYDWNNRIYWSSRTHVQIHLSTLNEGWFTLRNFYSREKRLR